MQKRSNEPSKNDSMTRLLCHLFRWPGYGKTKWAVPSRKRICGRLNLDKSTRLIRVLQV